MNNNSGGTNNNNNNQNPGPSGNSTTGSLVTSSIIGAVVTQLASSSSSLSASSSLQPVPPPLPPPPPPSSSSSSAANTTATSVSTPSSSSSTSSSTTSLPNTLPLSSSLPNSLSNSLNSIHGQQAVIISNSTPTPLSLSNSSNTQSNNINIVAAAAAAAVAASMASSSSSSSSSTTTSSSTSSTASNTDKMDTSFGNGCTSNDLLLLTNNLNGLNNLNSSSSMNVGDIISRLYPNVNQQETPLPRQWSTSFKGQTLSLSHGNLRVTYKGPGKTHKDAASVRTDYPIPPACGIYYYEVKIISKGRDGYMGIGLSKSDVLLNRLPGWDKNSYGYHGDDGHSFCCSGTGQNYGPTFTTGDVIGCCLNLIENTCFYTKNGYNLGIAFKELPGDLYPTVGLQTPSESVEANFGQYPFEFDIHNYVKEWHLKTRQTIERFPLKKENENNLPTILRKLISTYLVHHGYSSTAEAFAKSVGHVFEEELASIRNRQRIQKLVLNGQLDEAIELTYQLFPGILERNSNLLFALKVRQFIEMINQANQTNNNNNHSDSSNSQQAMSNNTTTTINANTDNTILNDKLDITNSKLTNLSQLKSVNFNNTMIVDSVSGDDNNKNKNGYSSDNGYSSSSYKNYSHSNFEEAMDMDSSPKHSLSSTSQLNSKTSNLLLNNHQNNNNHNHLNHDANSSNGCNSNNSNGSKSMLSLDQNDSLQKILQFGRELFQMNTQFTMENGENPANTKMLRDAFSLLAYHDPWNSPIGYQLDQSQREPISAMLNSAILEANNMPRIPPLEVVYGQTNECMRLMSKYGVAWCAYVNLADYMQS